MNSLKLKNEKKMKKRIKTSKVLEICIKKLILSCILQLWYCTSKWLDGNTYGKCSHLKIFREKKTLLKNRAYSLDCFSTSVPY